MDTDNASQKANAANLALGKGATPPKQANAPAIAKEVGFNSKGASAPMGQGRETWNPKRDLPKV